MDALQALRALALAYAPTADYPLCLDLEARVEILSLRAQYRDLAAKAAEVDEQPDEGATLSETPAHDALATKMAEVEDQLERAQAEARDRTVVLVFKRLPTTPEDCDADETSYAELVDQHTDDKRHIDYEALGAALIPLCYVRTEGEPGDLSLSYREASRLLDTKDRADVGMMLVGHHRIGGSIPFDPRSSGRHEAT